METRLPTPSKTGSIPDPIIIIAALIFCVMVYALASGAGSGRYLESDRMVVAECWKSIDRRATNETERRDMTEACARMERGFHLKHGATL